MKKPLALPLGVGLVMVAFGVSQMGTPRRWYPYLPERVAKLLPISKDAFFLQHGATNVLLGLWLISRIAAGPASRASLWWWMSVTPFAYRVSWESGARDTAILLSLLSYRNLLEEDRS